MLPAEGGGVPGAAEAVQKALDFTASSNKRLQFSSRSSRRERTGAVRQRGTGSGRVGRAGQPRSPHRRNASTCCVFRLRSVILAPVESRATLDFLS